MNSLKFEKIFVKPIVLYIYLTWIGLLTILVSLFDKGETFLFINHIRSYAFDFVFTIITYMGDGLFSLAIIVLLILLKKRQLAWLILVSFLFSGIISVVIKNIINEPRPILYFHENGLVKGATWMAFNKMHSSLWTHYFSILYGFYFKSGS